MSVTRKHLYPIIWFALISYASLTPPKGIPKFPAIPHFDKVVHFGIYYVLVIVLIPFFLKHKNYNRTYMISGITAVLTGIFFELMQLLITSVRSASFADALANFFGCILGIVSYQLLIRDKKLEKIIFRIE